MELIIKNGRVIDPANKIDAVMDVVVKDGKIFKVEKNTKETAGKIIDAKNKIVAPGLIDMHVHLREPGQEDKETVATGTRAAVKGGFTAVACMPNTTPACDSQSVVKFIIDQARKCGLAKVYPIGAITKKREGLELAEAAELKDSGCVALSDDGSAVQQASLMRRALEYASSFGLTVIAHCEDKTLVDDGCMNEGLVSTALGLKGMPNMGESVIVYRDIELAKIAGAAIHIAHVSTKEGVEIIRAAKKQGINVSAEVCPHHLALTDECCKTYDTNTKVNPPLRTADDVLALKQGLKDGTIDIIASDHAPHLESDKELEYDKAPFGMIGLETSLALCIMELIEKKILTWPELIGKMSANPARRFGLEGGSISPGAAADIVIIDPEKKWTYTKDSIVSKSKNTPFVNWQFKGAATHTIVNGKVLNEDGKILSQ